MPLALLRNLDRWVGTLLLYLLALPSRLVGLLVPASSSGGHRITFLKLKGGGSLIIALPTLIGLRQKYPQSSFALVCTKEAKIYAELTGLFDQYLLVDDTSISALLASSWRALRVCFGAHISVDLEPNSVLAAVFCMASAAQQRIGLVSPTHPERALAYTHALSFNPTAPIYIYYDQLAEILHAVPAPESRCQEALKANLSPFPLAPTQSYTLGIAPFTSDFAPERMMPVETWLKLLSGFCQDGAVRVLIFGSARNRDAASAFQIQLKELLPQIETVNIAGQTQLSQSASLLMMCDNLWAVDSGLLHIARALGVSNQSFWGPTMPQQRLRPMSEITEEIRYRPFLCSPCIQSARRPPCGGQNLCMITMAEEHPDLNPSWVDNQ